ncbi:MAG: SDR family oxidoreductase [Rhodothermales bacterium]
MSTSRIALVTGANKGIGFETARQLGAQGLTVLLGARSTERGTEAASQLQAEGYDVQFVHLDVTNSDHIQAAVQHIADTYGRLDVLVNNAGVQIESNDWGINNAATLPVDTLRDTFDINFFGLIELTQALLPLLEKSDAGRIVNVSSILGSLTLHAQPGSPIYGSKLLAYNASKTALNQFTIHLAAQYRDAALRVNSAHPGWVQTDMGGEEATMDTETGAKTIVGLTAADTHVPNGAYEHLGEQLPW